jgi:hypothetical protein
MALQYFQHHFILSLSIAQNGLLKKHSGGNNSIFLICVIILIPYFLFEQKFGVVSSMIPGSTCLPIQYNDTESGPTPLKRGPMLR